VVLISAIENRSDGSIVCAARHDRLSLVDRSEIGNPTRGAGLLHNSPNRSQTSNSERPLVLDLCWPKFVTNGNCRQALFPSLHQRKEGWLRHKKISRSYRSRRSRGGFPFVLIGTHPGLVNSGCFAIFF